MVEVHPVIKKLQLKDQSKPVLILNAPKEYEEVIASFEAEVHTEAAEDTYSFVQVFGTTNETIRELGGKAVEFLSEDGLLWLCYPKKSSKTYKGSDCSRESVAELLAEKDFEPVRQVAVDEDWSALRFRHVDNIKTMIRKQAVTEKGKQRVNDLENS
ncbi:DUF3052 domain-containing protein [Alkalihalobacterium chitinilyticum]|uniref:DUF3052 domain-containing protein n=1 Tax=Alkalihalobacterium chitinilyticum TaxID=2980103 RepID=A0ABT5VI51_9BACI|nr:DUF3052 domain-containing protein [Alkalihalobacterium chitinilyticum]MDE5414841.1 DUF3052 domain-containing protein [Alkalihalobacterium chitinilyticum]